MQLVLGLVACAGGADIVSRNIVAGSRDERAFNDASAWVGGIVPSALDRVTIGDGSCDFDEIVISTAVTVRSLQLVGNGPGCGSVLRITSSGSLVR